MSTSLSLFPAGVSAFDRTFNREYNNQRGAAINQQQTQRAFNSGYRKLMRGARGGDPRALDSLMRMAPNYQRIGDIDAAQYGPDAQDQLNVEAANAQAIGAVPSVSAMNQNFTSLWNRPTQGPLRSKQNSSDTREILLQPSAAQRNLQALQEGGALALGTSAAGQNPVADDPFGTGFLPVGQNNPFFSGSSQAPTPQTEERAFGQVPTDNYPNDLEPGQEGYDTRQPSTPYEKAVAAVMGRKREQIDQGQWGMQPLANPEAAKDALLGRLPPTQRSQLPRDQVPTTVQAVPGIGNMIGYDNGTRAMVGRYGTGTITNKPTPAKERMVTETDPTTGKEIKMTTTEWFRKAAERQGVANKFAENEAQIRRIAGMTGKKYQPPPPVR
jgi:hypothetical protein